MTLFTDGFDFQRLRVIGVMIFLCLRGTIKTFESSRWLDVASFDRLIDYIVSLRFFWIKQPSFFVALMFFLFPFFALSVSVLTTFSFFSFTITTDTGSALGIETIFCRFIFMKLRNKLDLLASGTPFRYDCLRHNLSF